MEFGTTPGSILVNKMLEDAIGTLSTSEHPLVHTDRGCHYRWAGWIKRMEAAELTRSMSKKVVNGSQDRLKKYMQCIYGCNTLPRQKRRTNH